MLKKEEKRHLAAELMDELLTAKDVLQEYDRFYKYDMFISEVLLFAIMYSALYTISNPMAGSPMALLSITGMFAYFYIKSIKRVEATSGKMFLDATTYIGGFDKAEQLEITGWELLVAPAESVTKEKIIYDADELMKTIDTIGSVEVTARQLSPPLIDEMAKVRAQRMIDEYKAKEARKKTDRKWFGIRRKKPTSDVSHFEDERDSVLKMVDDIDFEIIVRDDDGSAEEKERETEGVKE